MPTVLKSRSLDLLEPSGPVQASNGIALLLPSPSLKKVVLYTKHTPLCAIYRYPMQPVHVLNKYSLYIFLLTLVPSKSCVFYTVSSVGTFETKIYAYLGSVMRAVRPAHRFVFRSVDVQGTGFFFIAGHLAAGRQLLGQAASRALDCLKRQKHRHTQSRSELSLDKNRSWRKR